MDSYVITNFTAPGRNPNAQYVIFYTYVIPIWAIVGIILNFIVLWIYNIKNLSSSNTFLIKSLTWMDSISLILVTMNYSTEYLIWLLDPDPESTIASGLLSKIFIRVQPMTHVFQVLVTVYTLMLLVDYYVFEYKARTHLSWTNVDRTQKAAIIVLGLIVVLHIPHLLKYINVVYELNGERLILVCTSTLYLHSLVRLYDEYLDPIVFVILPLLIMAVLCISLGIKMFKGNEESQGEEKTATLQSYRGYRSGKTTLCICIMRIVNVILHAVGLVGNVLQVVTDEGGRQVCFLFTSQIVFNFFGGPWEEILVVAIMANSSFKFFIYVATQRVFRRLFLERFACNVCTRKEVNKGPKYKRPHTAKPSRGWVKIKAVSEVSQSKKRPVGGSKNEGATRGARHKTDIKKEVYSGKDISIEMNPRRDGRTHKTTNAISTMPTTTTGATGSRSKHASSTGPDATRQPQNIWLVPTSGAHKTNYREVEADDSDASATYQEGIYI